MLLDMEDTVEEVIKATSLPLSIIIVGVGSADFSKMERLVHFLSFFFLFPLEIVLFYLWTVSNNFLNK